MAIIEFGLVISDITESEGMELLNELNQNDIIDSYAYEGKIEEISYHKYRYSVEHIETKNQYGQKDGRDRNYVLHATSEVDDKSNEKGWLTLRWGFYESSTKRRDRVSYKSNIGALIENLENTSELCGAVEEFTDSEVSAGAIEIL